MVLKKEDRILSWLLGRIIQVLLGKDKIVWVVKMYTKDSIFTCSIEKLVSLMIYEIKSLCAEAQSQVQIKVSINPQGFQTLCGV